jgi:hypothetical protein
MSLTLIPGWAVGAFQHCAQVQSLPPNPPQAFFPYGFTPGLAWPWTAANGDGAGPPFFFLLCSALGFFFSLVGRI